MRSIGVGNGRHYGGGLSVDESAEPDDGLLNVYSVEISHWMQLARIYPAFRAGQHATRPEIRSFPCREVEIRTRRPRSINTDGEVTERTPARFKVIPGAVTILAPRAETAEAAA